MTPDDIESLRTWAATLEPTGMVQARQVLELIELHEATVRGWDLDFFESAKKEHGLQAEIERLRALNVGLAERVAAQSELLSRRADILAGILAEAERERRPRRSRSKPIAKEEGDKSGPA